MNATLLKAIAKQIAETNEVILDNRETAHLVHFNLQGTAVIKKGEDFTQTHHFSLPWEKMCAVLMSKLNGVTMDAVVREALEEGLDTTEIKVQAQKAMQDFKGLGVKSMGGKVTSKDAEFTATEVKVTLL